MKPETSTKEIKAPKANTNNCCANCRYARDYTGWEAHTCCINGDVVRAEVYNCIYFEEDKL